MYSTGQKFRHITVFNVFKEVSYAHQAIHLFDKK